MNKSSSEEFTFRKQDTIGANDAEDDKKFLLNCFINTGDYDEIEDFTSAKCLILGRTGAGKTALLTRLKDNKKGKHTVITLDAEALAMQHISNSPIIRQLFELDIDLNTFFKLLWRHAVCVEIFSHHFKVTTSSEHEDILEQLKYKFKKTNTKHLRAFNYLQDWKDTFWKQDNGHVIEMINRTESQLGGSLGANALGLSASVAGKKTFTEEEKHILQQQARSVVDETQLKEVSNLIEMLNEVIEDQQKQYYVVIDELDEGWVDDVLRYRLIKALIETVRDINRFDNLKPLVVLREDLLNHVFKVTHDTGFQEEKYQSLYMHIGWTRGELTALLDKRINYSFKSRYRKKHEVTHLDILPTKINGIPSIDYILNRTLMRPRDMIDFFNLCLHKAVESRTITEKMVLDAEWDYSRDRLKSLYYEWFIDYPKLEEWIQILREKGRDFFVGSLPDANLKERALKYAVENDGAINDRIYKLTKDFAEDKLSIDGFRNSLIHIFYVTGLIGLQINEEREPMWAYDLQENVSIDDINNRTFAAIHPCFRSALNIK